MPKLPADSLHADVGMGGMGVLMGRTMNEEGGSERLAGRNRPAGVLILRLDDSSATNIYSNGLSQHQRPDSTLYSVCLALSG